MGKGCINLCKSLGDGDGDRLAELSEMIPIQRQDRCNNIKLGQILLEYVCVDFDVENLENDTQCM